MKNPVSGLYQTQDFFRQFGFFYFLMALLQIKPLAASPIALYPV